MPKKTDASLVVLREIRDEIRELRGEVKGTNQRMESLERRQTETEVRLASELVAVARAVGEVRDLLRDRLGGYSFACEISSGI
jgi:hypothetical protein